MTQDDLHLKTPTPYGKWEYYIDVAGDDYTAAVAARRWVPTPSPKEIMRDNLRRTYLKKGDAT